MKIDKYYTGYTNNLQYRLERHNDGWGRYTGQGIPWKLVYHETYSLKPEAIRRENEIKKKKSRKYIQELISAGGRPE